MLTPMTKRFSRKIFYPSVFLAGLLAFAVPTIPANAVESEEQPALSETQDDVVLYEAETHFEGDGTDMTINLHGGFAEVSDSDEIEIYSDEGTFIEVFSEEAVSTGNGSSVSPSIEISKDQEQIFVTFDEDLGADSTSDNLITPFVNQDCALNNVLWGAGVGAANGLVGGVPGAVAGSMAGLLAAGVQSATSC